jgi:hypothetical protein
LNSIDQSTSPSAFKITDWRPRQNATLHGFFSIILPSGLVIRDCSLHRKGDRRWIGMPAREYEVQGERKFAPIVAFVDRAAEDRFRLHALDALDRYFAEAHDD